MKEKAAACLNFKRVGGVFDTENKMIKNIILDMGNVLIEYDVNRPLDALCPNESQRKLSAASCSRAKTGSRATGEI